MINFEEFDIQSYGDTQDQDLTVSTQNNGNTLQLSGNGWRKIDLPYAITQNTVLEFEFKSSVQGEIHGIGFDVDNKISKERTFKLYGTQKWGIDAFNTYTEFAGGWQTYSIPVGQFYTGEVSYLTFTNDQDISLPKAESLFKNLRIYEAVDTPLTQTSNPSNIVASPLDAIGEVGRISGLTHLRQNVTLQHHYDNPVIFAQTLSFNGGQPAAVRVDNIQSNSFELFIQEPSNLDGLHTTEDVSYIVLEAGSWTLEDGTQLEVGSLDSDQLVTSGFETIHFGQNFTDAPVVFSQVQTANGPDFVRTRQQAATANGFEVGMEEEEKKKYSGHTSESVGWLAIEAGTGSWGGLTYQVGQTGDSVTHDWESVDLSGFTSAPNFLASLASYDGSDSAGVRYRHLHNTSVEVKVEEDTSADAETSHTSEVVSFLAIQGNGVLQGSKVANSTTDPKGTAAKRDVTQQPFAGNSIWNTPIGSDAIYIDANIQWAKNATVDVDHFYILNGDAPLQPLYNHGTWGPGRTTGSTYQGISIPLPDDLLIADSTNNKTPNNSAAFLMPDGRTLVQVNALTRDRNSDFVYGKRLPFNLGVAKYEDIYGTGIEGAHAGSGLSSIGGTLRLGELIGADPIRHALKVNLWSQKYFSYTQGEAGGLGYRWPAVKADTHASPGTYAGTTPELLNGSLLAIPPDMTPEQLGIQTEAGRKLFYAFQDYGAYLADDTGWDAHAIAVEKGVTQEFSNHYGFSFTDNSGPFYTDYMQLFSALHVIDNNALDNIGGGGTPRAPLAPDFNIAPPPAFIGDADPNSLAGDDQANRMDGKGGNDLIQGRGGHDFITGGSGKDTLDGGQGNDHLIGDSSSDHLLGGDGNDYLDGGAYGDILEGGKGDDHLTGGTGKDRLIGGAGFDTVIESDDIDFELTEDRLIGTWTDTLDSIEQVILSGGNSNNKLDASQFQGTVHLHGGRGHDQLIGGKQGDILVSSSGNDTLTGGAGADTFDVSGRVEFLQSNRANPLRDGEFAQINDFNPSEDTLILLGAASHYVLGSGNGGTEIYLDTNGDGIFSQEDEIVAVIKGASSVDLNGSFIEYVA
ncbi:calcium-binding protein [Acaryochloris sp. IP29b_bin.148]|uniref:calcium-binding protein n=1 Tax=Acaryochloris sp. IP29b_bin.148 TaxID=2969218 RepID=UPI0026326276|nr:calcium-binding protein [Acaryochloris sp. IP29b_bin.148]